MVIKHEYNYRGRGEGVASTKQFIFFSRKGRHKSFGAACAKIGGITKIKKGSIKLSAP